MDLWKSCDDFHFERNAMDLIPGFVNLREGISAFGENYDLSCPSRTSTCIHIHHTSNTNIISMMF